MSEDDKTTALSDEAPRRSHLLCPICRHPDNIERLEHVLTKMFCELLYWQEHVDPLGTKDVQATPSREWKEAAHLLYQNDPSFNRKVNAFVRETISRI
jgi:hypothetical protein